MGFSNPETEEFKANNKDADWKLEMRNLVLNNHGEEGWELISCDSENLAYLKRKN